MFFRRRFGRRRVYRKTGLRKRAGGKRKVSKSIKSYVKRTIHRNIENKERCQYAANIALNAASYSTQSIGLIPPCGQGTNDDSRIGNQTKITKGIIKGHINLLPYNATTNPSPAPLWVRILLVRNLRWGYQQANLDSTSLGMIFRAASAAIGQQFNLLDMNLPVNSDAFRVLADKKFRLGSTSPSATGPVSSGTYFDNSHMSAPFYFNWGKYCKKVLKFDDNSSPYLPMNHNLYLIFMAVNADGTSNTYIPCEYHYVNHALYEDA